MSDLPPSPDPDGDTANDTGTPRWVKVFGIIALIVILLFVILLLTRGSHGPGRHIGGDASHTPSSGVTEHGVQQS
jgi:hypothetical protein